MEVLRYIIRLAVESCEPSYAFNHTIDTEWDPVDFLYDIDMSDTLLTTLAIVRANKALCTIVREMIPKRLGEIVEYVGVLRHACKDVFCPDYTSRMNLTSNFIVGR